jgi:hypothetical protein
MTSWRDVLPVHPAADLFPLMSADEVRALGENIKTNDLQVPIVLWAETKGAKPQLLDGRNRLDAMEAVGLEVLRLDKGNRLEVRHKLLFGSGGGFSALDGTKLTVDPFDFVLAANIHRRHLSSEQKRDLTAKVLKAKPDASNRQIAEQVNVSPTTVGAVRRELESTDQIGQLEKTRGKDGRARTTKPKKPRVNVAAEIEANREQIDRALKLPGNPSDRLRAKAAGVEVKVLRAARDSLPGPLKIALEVFRALSNSEQALFLDIVQAERLSSKPRDAVQLAADRAEARTLLRSANPASDGSAE